MVMKSNALLNLADILSANEEAAEFDREWKEGDRLKAAIMAKDFVQNHRAVLSKFLESYSREGLVDLLSAYRRAGREADRIIVDIWLMSEYTPQFIRGQMLPRRGN